MTSGRIFSSDRVERAIATKEGRHLLHRPSHTIIGESPIAHKNLCLAQAQYLNWKALGEESSASGERINRSPRRRDSSCCLDGHLFSRAIDMPLDAPWTATPSLKLHLLGPLRLADRLAVLLKSTEVDALRERLTEGVDQLDVEADHRDRHVWDGG